MTRVIRYEMNEKEEAAVAAFAAEQNKRVLEEQRLSMTPEDFKRLTNNGALPYAGAIGGAVSFEIYYTSIGQGIKVHGWGEVKDVTDFTSW
jgi:hypothetical protein